jgi:Uma2 family endonuclease
MAVPLSKLTPDEYLGIERDAEFKSEYFNGEMFAMAGGTPTHSELAANLITVIRSRLVGRGCKVYTSDLRVRTGTTTGLYTYPDVTVVCGKPVFATDEADVLTNPTLLVEVLSKSTEAKDRGFKFQQYKQIATLMEYVLVSQTEPLVERFWRSAGGEWTYADAHGMEATIGLNSIGIDVALAEIYRDIEFESSTS